MPAKFNIYELCFVVFTRSQKFCKYHLRHVWSSASNDFYHALSESTSDQLCSRWRYSGAKNRALQCGSAVLCSVQFQTVPRVKFSECAALCRVVQCSAALCSVQGWLKCSVELTRPAADLGSLRPPLSPCLPACSGRRSYRTRHYGREGEEGILMGGRRVSSWEGGGGSPHGREGAPHKREIKPRQSLINSLYHEMLVRV